jgi:hypothetical protein
MEDYKFSDVKLSIETDQGVIDVKYAKNINYNERREVQFRIDWDEDVLDVILTLNNAFISLGAPVEIVAEMNKLKTYDIAVKLNDKT